MIQWLLRFTEFPLHLGKTLIARVAMSDNNSPNYAIFFSDVDTFFINPICDLLLDILSPTYIFYSILDHKNTQEDFRYLSIKGLFPTISCFTFPVLIPLLGMKKWHHWIEYLDQLLE